MAVGTYYVYADGGDASVYASSTSSWSTARNAITGTVRTGNYIQATLSGPTRFIERTFLTIDTSAIPDGATISSAVLYVYITSVSNNNSPSYRLYGSTHTDSIVGSDYDTMGTTEFSGTYLTSPTASAFSSFTLNAAGIAAISKTGYTKFAIREAAYDVADSQPGGANLLQIADSSTANDPYLEVTYTVGTDYTITADLRTYTLTGISANLSSVRRMVAALGTYTLTGFDTALKMGRGIVAETGAYVLTGINTSVSSARTMVASLGTYTLTGINAGFTKGFGILAETGNYILTGFDAVLRGSNIWRNVSKNTSSWTNSVKNSSAWNNVTKTISSWTNKTKS